MKNLILKQILFLLFPILLFSQQAIELKTCKWMIWGSIENAQRMVGVHEVGNNRGKQVEEFLHSVNRNPGDSWCAAFQYWTFQQVEQTICKIPIAKTGLCYAIYIDAKGRGKRVRLNPQPGDLIIWRHHGKTSGHIGKIIRVHNGWYTTIEGNTSAKKGSQDNGDMVAYKERNGNNIGDMEVLCIIQFNCN
jgi:hypothetical protein